MPNVSYNEAINGKNGRLNRTDAAKWLGVTSKTMAEWKRLGRGPKCTKLGSLCFYYLSDLEDFVRRQR